ncbi:type III secretion system effector BopC [Bordetella bronchiseptica]|uniref:type III secretion system effector BopC n=1 Tax=Bordetella bronchiseptica TaxID=518 RepID=UPI000462018D|nr:type III secretion system effector BopC [Bordetella bronchiseptica]KDD12847.1 T3SS cytotoxic effector BteA [Bordetella bronchiseptica MBORD707]
MLSNNVNPVVGLSYRPLPETPPSGQAAAHPSMRLLEPNNDEFVRSVASPRLRHSSEALREVKHDVRQFQASGDRSLQQLRDLEVALNHWEASQPKEFAKRGGMVAELRTAIDAYKQQLQEHAPSHANLDVKWLDGLRAGSMALQGDVKVWMQNLEDLHTRRPDAFAARLQQSTDALYSHLEAQWAKQHGTPPTASDVVGMPQWQEYTAMLRERFAGLDTIRPNLTAEENGVAILRTQTQLLALQRAQEALQASLADGVSHQGDVGLLRTQLLAGMVEGLIALQQADDDSALWSRAPAGDSGGRLSVESGAKASADFEAPASKGELLRGKGISGEAVLEAFANIEMSVSGSRAGAAGEAEGSLRLYGESTARAEVSGSFEPSALSASIGREEADGDTEASSNAVLSLNVSAELSSKLGLEAQGSVTLGSLLKLDAEGRAEVGASAEVSGTAAIDKRTDGLGVRLEGQAEAFVGLKAEGTLTANLLHSKYAEAHGLTASVTGSANVGLGATAEGKLVASPGQFEMGGEVGTTLGVGGNIGWNSKVDVNASTAYAYELASAAMARFDALRASQLDHDAKTSGNESQLNRLAASLQSHIDATSHKLDALNSAGVENRIRKVDGFAGDGAQAAAGLAAQMALVGTGADLSHDIKITALNLRA